MFVRNYMTTDVITIHPTASVEDAFQVMREHDIQQLPVLDFNGELVGMITERDVLLVSPSPTASVTLHEMLYALSNLKITEVMTPALWTVDADAPLEEAAKIMLDHKVDALPVLREGRLVGIITQEDCFRVFLQAMDNRLPAIQMTLLIPDEKGIIAFLCREVSDRNGTIVSLGEFGGRHEGTRTLTLNVAGLTLEEMRVVAERAVSQKKCQLLDLRHTTERREGQ